MSGTPVPYPKIRLLLGATRTVQDDPTSSRRLTRSKAVAARRRRRRILIAAASALAAVLIAVVTFAVVLSATYQQNVTVLPDVFRDDDRRPAEATGEAAKAQTILLIGSDARAGLGSNDIDDVEGSLADVIMIARISSDRESIHIMSIPRDSWVKQPNGSMGKINWSFSTDGAAGLVQTVETMLDVRIDHVAAIDFQSFKGLTDALGGVTVNNTVEWQRRGERFPVGPVELDGEKALIFVRERTLTGGDLARVKQQQEYIRAVLAKTLTAETLTDPGKLLALVQQVSPFLAVDEGLSPGYLAGLAVEMPNIRANDVRFFTMPVGQGTFVGDQAVLPLDPDDIAELSQAFRDDTLDSYDPPPTA